MSKTPNRDELIRLISRLNETGISKANISRKIANSPLLGIENEFNIKSDLSRLNEFKTDSLKLKKLLDAVNTIYEKELNQAQENIFTFKMEEKCHYYIYYYLR